MKTEIISIGDEILIGQVTNTNAAFLGEKLSGIGCVVSRITTVGDRKDEILAAFRLAWNDHDVVITTGGLGPTHDDITRDAVLDFFQTDLVFSEEVFADVRSFFLKLRRTLLPTNRDQAMIPRGADVIRNDSGTAPGYHFRRDGKHFFVLPGVPYEMMSMTERYILPVLQAELPNTRSSVTLLTTSIAESVIAAKIEGIEALLQEASLAYLPSPAGVRLRLTAHSGDRMASDEKLAELRRFITDRVPDYIFGEGVLTLEEKIGALLLERGWTLATAESCTGGILAGLLTNVSGSSQWFERGVVAYSNQSKTDLLGVDPNTIAGHGAVSRETALEMASGIRREAGASIGVSVTGIAGPTGGTEEKPVGLVWVGISAEGIHEAFRFFFGDNRYRTRQRAAQAALDIVRRFACGLPFHLFPTMEQQV
jgi:nicotinamide-nucleotide amidase